MKYIIFLFFLLIDVSLSKNNLSCQPFGVRLSFGSMFILKQKQSNEQFTITFNTRSNCSQSYVIYKTSNLTQKRTCIMKKLQTSAATNYYTTYIYRISISNINFAQKFLYQVYGWTGSAEDSPKPYQEDAITATIKHPDDIQQQANFIVIADWSYLILLKDRYTPLSLSFKQLDKREDITGMIVNGDIGYDLDTNNGTNYENYLIMLSQIAAYYPTIHLTGNHQYNSKDNYQLYVSSFDLYGLDKQLAYGIKLGPFIMAMFDPHEVLYSSTQIKVQTPLSLINLQQVLQDTKQYNRQVILMSHYPLFCSGSSHYCKNDHKYLKQYFDLMFNNDIYLYIGAHWHTYQRIYPYLQNGSTLKLQSPYNMTNGDNFLLSIVQGIAGNDKKIVQSYKKVQNFTAALSYNITGLGFLKVNKKNINYTHYTTKNTLTMVDQMIINLKQKQQNIILS